MEPILSTKYLLLVHRARMISIQNLDNLSDHIQLACRTTITALFTPHPAVVCHHVCRQTECPLQTQPLLYLTYEGVGRYSISSTAVTCAHRAVSASSSLSWSAWCSSGSIEISICDCIAHTTQLPISIQLQYYSITMHCNTTAPALNTQDSSSTEHTR